MAGLRRVTFDPDLVGRVGIGGEREVRPRLDAHLRERLRRVDLLDVLLGEEGDGPRIAARREFPPRGSG